MSPGSTHEVASFYESIEVQMDSWDIGKEGQLLATSGLGTCTGVAIYDPLTHTGHMAHLASPLADRDLMEAMLESVRQNSTTESQLKAWVRGCSEGEDEDLLADVAADRNYVLDSLGELGILDDSLDVNWLESPEGSVDMALNCSSGVCETITEDYLDDTN